jgi:phenylalanyl-tRNA synthetase alpha chain
VSERIQSLRQQFEKDLASARDAGAIEGLRVRYLGRKGVLNDLMAEVPKLSPEERPVVGRLANELKRAWTETLAAKAAELGKGQTASGPGIDVTLPGRALRLGHRHPISRTLSEVVEIFGRLGFSAVYGPEIETAYYNFEALNTPPDHPSLEPSDTFYLADGFLLRTQTSPVQVHVMEKTKPPIRIIAPGKVYRPDTVDASHSFMFHQCEGLMVDTDVTMADLVTVLTMFCQQFFGPEVKIRLRPHFFPFTEPSAELDISCIICGGKGCAACSQKGWLEAAGCGMVDPAVFKAVGYDNEKYTGFAFGFGVDRLAMLKYGIRDLRLLFENDVRFLSQF